MSRLTTTEVRLVEQYVSGLDYVSRGAQAIDTDDWFYLYDKSAELAVRAERLAELAAELWRTIDWQGALARRGRIAGGGAAGAVGLGGRTAGRGRRPRGGAIAAAVAWQGRHYRAGRLLHPQQQR